MSTLEEFEAAPVGATASNPDGRSAVKTPHKEWPWSLFDEDGERIAHGNHHHMATQGWTLDPSPAVPASAREALDLAWDLAHPVREEQVIPAHHRVLGRYGNGDHFFVSWIVDRSATKADETDLRTLDPLPDPEPDWLDAPAVLAATAFCDDRMVWTPERDHEGWSCDRSRETRHWSDLRDVTPLYPKEAA